MKKKSPFYKTGPLFFGPGRMATDSLDSSSDGKADAEALMDEYGESGKAVTEYNKSKSSSNTEDMNELNKVYKENAVSESNKLLGRNIATGKGSGKLNRARRKLDKATMQAEGKSRADVRQTKAKSKRLETRAKMESVQKSGDKSQATKERIKRLDAKRGRLKKREARIEGRKAKKRETAKYLKNN